MESEYAQLNQITCSKNNFEINNGKTGYVKEEYDSNVCSNYENKYLCEKVVEYCEKSEPTNEQCVDDRMVCENDIMYKDVKERCASEVEVCIKNDPENEWCVEDKVFG